MNENLISNNNSPLLIDTFGRRIEYLRISVTDKCNFRCIYCMPPEGIESMPQSDILSYEQITIVAKTAAQIGIKKIKITGGEPLVRKDIELLVSMLSVIPDINDLGMTTNGSLLTMEKARLLRDAGLTRINISLDTLDSFRFSHITRGANLKDVLCGIEAVIEAGFAQIKINMVIMEDTTEAEILEMQRFCVCRGLQLQTISQFSLHKRSINNFLSTDRPPLCNGCNRIRLTADGFLKPCLFSDREIKLNWNDIVASFCEATREKPETGYSCWHRAMNQIGG